MPKEIDPRKLAVGRRIKLARENKGLSQHALGRQVGVTPGAVGQWELGITLATMHVFDQLPALLDVSREWLLTGDDSQQTLQPQTRAEETSLRLFRALPADDQSRVIAMLAGLARPPETGSDKSD